MKKILDEISEERIRQYKKGYTFSHDDKKPLEEFCDDIIAYATWAKQMLKMGSPEKYRRRMKQIGALSVAACESFDRKSRNPHSPEIRNEKDDT